MKWLLKIWRWLFGKKKPKIKYQIVEKDGNTIPIPPPIEIQDFQVLQIVAEAKEIEPSVVIPEPEAVKPSFDTTPNPNKYWRRFKRGNNYYWKKFYSNG